MIVTVRTMTNGVRGEWRNCFLRNDNLVSVNFSGRPARLENILSHSRLCQPTLAAS